METTQTLTKIIEALLKSQKEIENVKKEAENPYFKSKYADLNSLIEACKKILNDNGILILQPINGEFVETTLFHTSGESISSRTKIVSKSDNNPQDQGSAITYARRYGLQSMLFMSAEDDDGEKATDHKSERENGVKTIIRDNVVREPIDMSKSPSSPDNEFRNSTCKDCGGRIAISKLGKPYCTNRCWLPENKHFITEFRNKK
jgi:hypothetical protein